MNSGNHCICENGARLSKQFLLIGLVTLLLASCGGGGGGGSGGGGSGSHGSSSADYPPDAQYATDESYRSIEVHLGYENEASATRINYPIYILADILTWRDYDEEFRQLGLLTDIWDTSNREDIQIPETRNIAIPLLDVSLFRRQVKIVRTDWATITEVCGTNDQGEPNHGCAYHYNVPYCTIYVPRPDIYQGGNLNSFHTLLGHEMWHCLVGSFH